MMELQRFNGKILDYYDLQDREKIEQVPQTEVSVTTILFDEAHGEVLRSQPDADDFIGPWKELGKLLREAFGPESVASHSKDGGLITPEILSNYQILVLAAPTELFNSKEVEAITQFVRDGNALLIAASSRSIYEQLAKQPNRDKRDVNALLENFGLQFKSLLNSPPEEICDLYPDFLTSEVNRLFVNDPAYLEVLSDACEGFEQAPRIIARLPHSYEPWLATIEPTHGAKIVAISNWQAISFTGWHLRIS
jgi:hypothetical protein